MHGVSVIIAVRNRRRELRRCLDSVAAQRDVDVQPIVFDALSTDGTVDILERNRDWIVDRGGHVESAADTGIYDAWNKGLAVADRDWVHFLGADDAFWDRDALARLCRGSDAAGTGAGLVYGRVGLFDGPRLLGFLGRPWAQVASIRFDKMPFPHPGVLHRRQLFERLGGFDTRFRIAGDFEWFCRALKDETPVFIDNGAVVAMSLGGASSNPRGIAAAALENERARQQNGVAPPRSLWGRCVGRAARTLPGLLPAAATAGLVRLYYRHECSQAAVPPPEWPPESTTS